MTAAAYLTTAMNEPTLLDCPSCGAPCEGVPPDGYNRNTGHVYWSDGQWGKCQCGTEVMVTVDEDDDGYNVARLTEDEDEP